MKIEKKPWERGLIIGIIISLGICALVSAGASFWLEHSGQAYSRYDSMLAPGLCVGVLLLACCFLRRIYTNPLIWVILSLVLTITLVCASHEYFTEQFYSRFDNPEYAEWVSTDPTPDTEITLSDILRMESSPGRYIEAQTSSSRFAESVYIICGISSGICALLFLIYFFFWLQRFFVPLQHKRNQTKAIKKREKAFAQIEKFHEYKEKGIMTEEEYQESRQRVLESID